jgi:hypothetical protein
MNYLNYDHKTSRFCITEIFTKGAIPIPIDSDNFTILLGENYAKLAGADSADLLDDDFVDRRVNFKIGHFDVHGALRNPQFIEYYVAKYTFTRIRIL